MHMLRTVRNKTHDTDALVRACSAWARYERERDIVRPPTPVQITPELPTVTVFIPTLQEIWSDPREKQCGDDGDDLNTAVASHYRGEAVMRLSSQP